MEIWSLPLQLNDDALQFHRLTLPANPASLKIIQGFVGEHAELAGLSLPTQMKINLVLEEALLNVFTHAYPLEESGFIDVECGLSADGQKFLVRFRDQGRPFDPLSQPRPDVGLSMDERTEGGLGILLIREMSLSQNYRREGKSNVLELVFEK
jgi:serine/threonine-protein kinase RsbW